MRFDTPLIPGRLVRRYKRFLSDVELADGTVVTAHCPNPGSMMGLDTPGLPAWLSRSDDPKRKLAHTLEVLELPDGAVGIHTGRPNALVAEAVAAGVIAELAGYASMRREVKYGKSSRVDLLLEGRAGDSRPAYVEVKNVHLRRETGRFPTAAEFPDSVTRRGAKHLVELADMVAEGHRAVMVFCVQRTDCDHFRVAGDIDPAYLEALKSATAAGVEAVAYACAVSPEAIAVEKPIPIVL